MKDSHLQVFNFLLLFQILLKPDNKPHVSFNPEKVLYQIFNTNKLRQHKLFLGLCGS